MAKNKRNGKLYPAVDPSVNLKSRYEEISDVASYFNTLPEDAKKYMHSFVEEYVNAKFNHSGKKIHRKKEQKRSVYNRNNARNRDILTKAKASGTQISLDALRDESSKDFLFSVESNQERLTAAKAMEDLIIAKIDYENKLKEKKSRPRKKLKKLNSGS